MSQRKTLCKLTWLTFMPLLFVSSYFVMLLNFSCDGFKYYVFTLEGTAYLYNTGISINARINRV
ncbi:hypothetical protein F0D86_10370 [Escherichia coli]|nr:hypothetical protein [Escherichia coli]MDN1160696.1 hypothetical protein [Escherichia coli]